MTDEAKLRVAALRWAHLHEDCNDADDTCPVQDECLRCANALCNLRTAANLIVSLSAELERVKRERDAAIADMTDIADNYVVCMHCKKRDEESGACDKWHDQDSCWQWRGVKEE